MSKSDGRIHASKQRPFKPPFFFFKYLSTQRITTIPRWKILEKEKFIRYTKDYGENKNLEKEYTRACALDHGPRRLAGGFLLGADENN